MLMVSLLPRRPVCRNLLLPDRLLGGVGQAGGGNQVGLGQDAPALLLIRADQADDKRHADVQRADGFQHAACDFVAAGDAAEDVDQHRLDALVGQDDAQRRRNLVGLRAAADIQEVGRLAAVELDDVHRGHRQPGAVDHAADLAVQVDVGEVVAPRLALAGVFLVGIAQLGNVRVAEERVVVHRNLAVQRHQLVVARDHQRVDLRQAGVHADKRPVERLRDLDEVLGQVLGNADAVGQDARHGDRAGPGRGAPPP